MTEGELHPSRFDPVLGVIALAGAASVLFLPFYQFAPNRIVTGTDLTLMGSSLPAFLILLGSWALVGAFSLLPPAARSGPASSWVWLVVPLPVLAAGLGAVQVSWALAGSQPIARVTLGSGFWVTLLGSAIAGVCLPSTRSVRLLALGISVALVVASLSVGAFDALSLVREAKNLGPTFVDELVRHLSLTGWAVASGTVLGLVLGIAAHRSPSWRLGGFLTLNFLQTVPSLALFGLLILPLAWLSTEYPLLRDWGIKGIGATPALIALSLYAALPVARNTLTALDEMPAAVIDAGRGMGMSGFQLGVTAMVPLAWPAILAGIRVSVVQTIGNVVVAALIGAGGLGVFVFQGLGQTAMDLVLLGTLPVVVLALAADFILGLPAQFRGGR